MTMVGWKHITDNKAAQHNTYKIVCRSFCAKHSSLHFNIWWISGCRTLISFEYLYQNKDEQRDGEQFSVQHRQIKLSDLDLTCNNIPSQTSDFFFFFLLEIGIFGVRALHAAARRIRTIKTRQDAEITVTCWTSEPRRAAHLISSWAECLGGGVMQQNTMSIGWSWLLSFWI